MLDTVSVHGTDILISFQILHIGAGTSALSNVMLSTNDICHAEAAQAPVQPLGPHVAALGMRFWYGMCALLYLPMHSL